MPRGHLKVKTSIPKNIIRINTHDVHGIKLNAHTGCAHYAGVLDIIAVKFKCCQHYYACYSCHLALTNHSTERWSKKDFHTRALLCGRCGVEMTICEYLACNSTCLHCQSPFNPRCKLHWNLYFQEIQVDENHLLL
jgi:uncharacterized CHY-type Zn-finger protein